MTNKEIKANVMDLLNQIVVLTKEIKSVETGIRNEDTYKEYSISQVLDDSVYGKDSEVEKFTSLPKEEQQDLLDQDYLSNANSICSRIANGNAESADYNERQYYNSNCY